MKTNRTTIASVAGAALATAAGIAAAVKYLKSRGDTSLLHVQPNGEGWAIMPAADDKPLDVFPTKKEAVAKARELAAEAAPSRLVIHRADGSEQRSHAYEGS